MAMIRPAVPFAPIVFGVAVAVAMGSYVWFLRSPLETLADLPPERTAVRETVRTIAALPLLSRWEMTAGDEGFDLFSSPVIRRDLATRQMLVGAESAGPPAIAEGWRLLRIDRPQFPLQLVGFIGSGEHVRGVFEIAGRADSMLGTGGSEVPELGLRIESVRLLREREPDPRTGSVPRLVALAEVHDRRSGETITLKSTGRFGPGPARATLLHVATGIEQTAAAGESIVVAEGELRVLEVQLAPPAVRVALPSRSQDPVTHWLPLNDPVPVPRFP